MSPDDDSSDSWTLGAPGLALLRSTAVRPPAPLKLNLCLTYWCQYKCKTCNIWQRKPTDELTTDELRALVRENPHVNWVDLTGGEIFLRPDIDEIFDAILTGWSRLALLHFPTNGFQTDRIVAQRRADCAAPVPARRSSSPSAWTATRR